MVNQNKIGYLLIIFSILLILIISFVKANIDEQEAYLCELTHNDPNYDLTQCPAHNSNNSWLIISAYGLGFLILGGGIYLVIIPVKSAKRDIEFKEFDLSRLDDEEKKIYELLKNKEGSMFQSDIIKETDMSKVQITRILDKLEAKKVIERKRRGMTNIVILK